MQLLSISRAQPRAVEHNGRSVMTGIFKVPVAAEEVVRVTCAGLEGDGQADLENHGGVDKAVYVYTVENYGYWQAELGGRPMPHGQFGENFTVSGLPDEAVHVGDVFQIGEIVVQITQPRVPCFKLGLRMGSPEFPRRFMTSGRVGFYLRVLRTGTVRSGDAITCVQTDPERLTVRDCMLALQAGPRQQEIIRRALSVKALSGAWRADLQRRLG